MENNKKKQVEFGDFQTPAELAKICCEWIFKKFPDPSFIVEPSCGKGTFLQAANTVYPSVSSFGLEINSDYASIANSALQGTSSNVLQGDFFNYDWKKKIGNLVAPILVIGNPPWVTSSSLSLHNSSNTPKKSNFQNMTGIEAITGKANFDISEWMLFEYAKWLENTNGAMAVLCKTSVARKFLKKIWKSKTRILEANIVEIDANKFFGVAVDACLLFVPFSKVNSTKSARIFNSFENEMPHKEISQIDNQLISDKITYKKHSSLAGVDQHYRWRSGVKHDCAKVMELSLTESANQSSLGDLLPLRDEYIYPLLKSSDIAKGRVESFRKSIIITQKFIGEETAKIEKHAPEIWSYLEKHSNLIEKRKSKIYKNKPKFSIFGIGDYSFSPYKIAISGMYKKLEFRIIKPINHKEVMVDDTVYFISAFTECEANFLFGLLKSSAALEFFTSQIFWDEKRPITADLLKRLDLGKLAKKLGQLSEYQHFTKRYTLQEKLL